MATGGLSGGLLGMFDSRGQILGLGRIAAQGVSTGPGGAHGRKLRAPTPDEGGRRSACGMFRTPCGVTPP